MNICDHVVFHFVYNMVTGTGEVNLRMQWYLESFSCMFLSFVSGNNKNTRRSYSTLLVVLNSDKENDLLAMKYTSKRDCCLNEFYCIVFGFTIISISKL